MCGGTTTQYFWVHLWTSSVHSQQTSSASSSLYMFGYASVVRGDLNLRDERNIESLGLVTGQGDVPFGYGKEYAEQNMLRLLQDPKDSIQSRSL